MKLGNVTLEELKALQEDRTCDISQGDAVALRRRSDAILKFYERISDNFPAIIAKLEAAQSSLEEIAMLADHQIPAYAFGDNEAACDLASRMSSIYKLAAFDKEQQ